MTILILTYVITTLILFVVLTILWALTRLVQHVARCSQRVSYKRFGWIGFAIAVLWAALLVYGYSWGRWQYEVIEVEYDDARLPRSFDGYSIVHISDFHLEGFEDNPAYVDTMVLAINRLQPDLICFTGDLVSFSHSGAEQFKEKLSQLKALDGVVAILGNHDYGVYERSMDSLQREADRQQLIDLQRNELGWHLLLNENLTLHHGTDSIAILGCENQACGMHQRVRRGNLASTMQGTEHMFQLLLAHDPSQWDAEVLNDSKIPLTLSGHTHAMQCRIWGWTPCRWFMKRSDGAYDEGKQHLYVNIGLGELMPFRIGATPEITHITLRSNAKSTSKGEFKVRK